VVGGLLVISEEDAENSSALLVGRVLDNAFVVMVSKMGNTVSNAVDDDEGSFNNSLDAGVGSLLAVGGRNVVDTELLSMSSSE
jgi:hypothetical protein